MVRPRKRRRVCGQFDVTYFKPAGIPMRELSEVVIGIDEMEALRLADLEGRYQADAADEMGVSRPTFSNIVNGARQKIADALISGKAIRVEAAPVSTEEVEMMNKDDIADDAGQPCGQGRRRAGNNGECECRECGHRLPHQAGVPCNQMSCPECGGRMKRV